MNKDNLLDRLKDGVLLGMLAKLVSEHLAQWNYKTKADPTTIQPPVFKTKAKSGSFQARANVHNFIEWTRALNVPMTFETADLIDSVRSFHVSACLMDVARGAPYLKALPALVEFERELEGHEAESEGTGSNETEEEESEEEFEEEEVEESTELMERVSEHASPVNLSPDVPEIANGDSVDVGSIETAPPVDSLVTSPNVLDSTEDAVALVKYPLSSQPLHRRYLLSFKLHAAAAAPSD